MERTKVMVQIVALMICIFLAGGWAGWTLGRSRTEPSMFANGAGRNRPPSQERLIREFKLQLNLTAEQEQKLQPLLSEWGKAVTQVDQSRLKDRRELFRKYAPGVRTHLTPEQQALYDRMTRRVEAFQERRILP